MNINNKEYNISEIFKNINNKNKTKTRNFSSKLKSPQNNYKTKIYYKNSYIKTRIENIKRNIPNLIIYNFNSRKKNKNTLNIHIKEAKSKSLTYNSFSNDIKARENTINIKTLKKIKKSKSINDLTSNYKFYLKNNKTSYSPNYEYNKYLVYKMNKNKGNEENNFDYIKEKYFIRGLALNKELAFYYHECKKVDFAENDDKNKQKKYIYNKASNIKKIKFMKSFINNQNNYKIINNKKRYNKNRYSINYSLKNLLNNKLPFTNIV